MIFHVQVLVSLIGLAANKNCCSDLVFFPLTFLLELRLLLLQDCTIAINTSLAFNYTHDMWGGIAVTVRDYNKDEIYLNTTRMIANAFALGGTTVQVCSFNAYLCKIFYETLFKTLANPSRYQILFANLMLPVSLMHVVSCVPPSNQTGIIVLFCKY